MRVEVYAGNLHHGGAVVVAATFLDQLPFLWGTEAVAWIDHLTVVMSPRVAGDMVNLSSLEALDRLELIVKEDRPKVFAVRRMYKTSDVRFTIFGPAYGGRSADVEVLGFADGSILPTHHDANPIGIQDRRASTRLVDALKRRRKLALLKQSDIFIVQTQSMATVLAAVVPDRVIQVVPNTVPAVFHDESMWRSFPLPDRQRGEVRLLYPARGYPHKNHAFIPGVCDAFERSFGVPLRVVVTLRPDEVRVLGMTDEDRIINVGEVSVADCPSLYEQTDGLLFPSLNETASSSPMEALFMGKPVFAPDLPFMRRMTNGFAYYYSAYDRLSAANAIRNGVSGYSNLAPEIKQGISWARGLPKPVVQAQAYLSLLRKATEGCPGTN